jgi:hypothetical protein
MSKFYENKKWFRKAVTLLIDNGFLFEAVVKDAETPGQYQLGVKYQCDGWYTTFPESKEDLELIAGNLCLD